jgi:hypothetical protein
MVAPLMRCLSNANVHLRCYAAVALGNCRSSEALPLIENLVTNDNIGGGTLAAITRQALDNIAEHPVTYGARPGLPAEAPLRSQ